MNVLIKINVPEEKLDQAIDYLHHKMPGKVPVGSVSYYNQSGCGHYPVFHMMVTRGDEDRMTVNVTYEVGESW